jgi:agmatinase
MNENPSRPSLLGPLESPYADYGFSRVIVVPVPLERTTSYGKGTARGPVAILRASQHVELWDEELQSEPYRLGIATLPALTADGSSQPEYLSAVTREVQEHLGAGKFVLVLGGEHSLSLAPIEAARQVFGELGVVQFDAHADLRDQYEGTALSHACVMHRILDAGLPTLAIGIRSLSTEEARLIARRNLHVVWGHQLGELTPNRFCDLLSALPRRVYLTFDVDFFDPSLVPATGTPEPGGGAWYPTLGLLRTLFREKEVVAMDLVELAPLAGDTSSDFAIARLAYKCVGYLQAALG